MPQHLHVYVELFKFFRLPTILSRNAVNNLPIPEIQFHKLHETWFGQDSTPRVQLHCLLLQMVN